MRRGTVQGGFPPSSGGGQWGWKGPDYAMAMRPLAPLQEAADGDGDVAQRAPPRVEPPPAPRSPYPGGEQGLRIQDWRC